MGLFDFVRSAGEKVFGKDEPEIARAQHGNASLYKRIFEVNRPLLTDPSWIYPGQVLRLPPLEP